MEPHALRSCSAFLARIRFDCSPFALQSLVLAIISMMHVEQVEINGVEIEVQNPTVSMASSLSRKIDK
jgi:hypothetical protein